MRVINWGIIGPGKIASKFAATFKGLEDGKILSVASRSIEKARDFAERYNIEKAFGSYDEMLDDPQLDIVYIATPHTFHFEHSLKCINKGKHVLCEKPITINSTQLRILVDTAKKKNIFLMQALWTRFLPTITTAFEIIKSGVLGKIKVIDADFGFKAEYDPMSRLFNPELGGGSLLDIGIYPVFLSLFFKGYPDMIKASAVKTPTGVDESVAITFHYNDAAIACLYSTFAAQTGTKASICCENGRIEINTRWIAPSSMQVIRNNEKITDYNFDYGQKTGFEGEIIEAMRCIKEGVTESPLMSSDFSINLMKLLDGIRDICDIHYPNYEDIKQ